MSVPDFKPVIEAIKLCKPINNDDVIIAITAFADYWEKYEFTANLSDTQDCIYETLYKHFMKSE